MSKTAILFSGQGSFYQHMALDVLKHFKDKRAIINNILGYDLVNFLEEEQTDLKKTIYQQPITLVNEILLYDLVKEHIKPDALAGFSLGEIACFYAADIFSLSDTIKLVKKRSELMEESLSNDTGMSAVIGFDTKLIEDLVSDINTSESMLVVANYNTRGQVVISGHLNAINEFNKRKDEANVKRIIPLDVSGAFHTPLLSDAGKFLREYAKTLKANKPSIDVYLNTDVSILTYDKLYDEIENQIKSPVYFEAIINKLLKEGFDKFITVGPGVAIKGFIKRIKDDANVITIETIDDINKLKE